ncbi:hypothetical protein Salat_2473500 [Sesamum alatum]|uniref:Uncharacterized protein n=1 Tax=Sesamum alatum TaxID=300844 RepID=A0AAE2CC10_9LAMI|nr:hypothetical protein Salat_2473500 [Sesamum alatum]
MAVEVFPDSPRLGVSPRISFDLSHYDIVPVEQYIRSSSSSSIDFDFCVFRESFDQESSSADELFFDGKILPIEIKRRLAPPRTAAAPPLPHQGTQRPVEIKATNTETEEKQINQKSSFWRFKRSSSLNCGTGYARTLCPLPLLSRSNSTGSTASSVKRSSLSNNQKQNFLKYSSPNTSLKPPPSSGHQKPPLKKTIHGSYCNGVKFNPVLNVPPATLFGLGSIFSGGKNGGKKK